MNDLETLMHQIQAIEIQINEIDGVLEEIKDKEEVYELISNFLIKKPKKEIEEKLIEKKEMLAFKLQSLKKKLNELKSKGDGK
ncbi:MAG: prefoldin subunit [Candidatus Woesearchaeota archaeon]